MMVERRKTQHCNLRSPLCMTLGFMLGMVVGTVICTNKSLTTIGLSVVVATVVFHLTFVQQFDFKRLLSKVIRKGS